MSWSFPSLLTLLVLPPFSFTSVIETQGVTFLREESERKEEGPRGTGEEELLGQWSSGLSNWSFSPDHPRLALAEGRGEGVGVGQGRTDSHEKTLGTGLEKGPSKTLRKEGGESKERGLRRSEALQLARHLECKDPISSEGEMVKIILF